MSDKWRSNGKPFKKNRKKDRFKDYEERPVGSKSVKKKLSRKEIIEEMQLNEAEQVNE